MPSAKSHLSDLAGPDKVAITMVALGEEHCAKLWPLMDDVEKRAISAARDNLGRVDPEVLDKLFVEFVNLLSSSDAAAATKVASTRRLIDLVERHGDEAVSIMRNWMHHSA